MSDLSLSEFPVLQHRTLFLSDLHLGAIGSRADLVLKFLRRNVAQTYVLVGDILDIGQPFLPHWTPSHQAVIDHLQGCAAAGAQLVYVRGNHDPYPADTPDRKRLPVEVLEQAEHHGADGRRYLVVHGDGQDARMFQSLFLTRFGSRVDQALRAIDTFIGRHVYDPGPNRRSIIEYVLSCVNWGLYPSRAHELRLVALAQAGGFDGIICGHFHMAELHDDHGLIYANCGDWMDSFTALAEDRSGRLHLMGGREAFAAAQPVFQPGMVRI